ncbi:MAG: hypothetical protein MUF06_16395 [Pirellulaceae bacterium]|nr:hypothetical protein [Pirellulaceae bacterium]
MSSRKRRESLNSGDGPQSGQSDRDPASLGADSCGDRDCLARKQGQSVCPAGLCRKDGRFPPLGRARAGGRFIAPHAAGSAGIHKLICDQIEEESFDLPPEKNRVLVSYETGSDRAAYIELVGIGDPLPEMPLFLSQYEHVLVPLEAAYQATWESLSEEMREAVETGKLPVVEE